MLTTLHLGRRTLLLGYARQQWLTHFTRSSHRGASCLLLQWLGLYAVLCTTAVPVPPMPVLRPLTHRYPDPEQRLDG